MQILKDAHTGHAVVSLHIYPNKSVLVRECKPETFRLGVQDDYMIVSNPDVRDFPCIHCRRLLSAQQ